MYFVIIWFVIEFELFIKKKIIKTLDLLKLFWYNSIIKIEIEDFIMKKQLIVTTIAAGSLLGSVTNVGAQEQATNVTKPTSDAPITTEVKSTETTTVTKPVTNEEVTVAKTETVKQVSQQDVDPAKAE